MAGASQHRAISAIGHRMAGSLSVSAPISSGTYLIGARAFDEKVESMIVDSHDGANRIQDPHWNKGASHEWGSLIPTICANVLSPRN